MSEILFIPEPEIVVIEGPAPDQVSQLVFLGTGPKGDRGEPASTAIDGGSPGSVYGGTTPIDGGAP